MGLISPALRESVASVRKQVCIMPPTRAEGTYHAAELPLRVATPFARRVWVDKRST